MSTFIINDCQRLLFFRNKRVYKRLLFFGSLTHLCVLNLTLTYEIQSLQQANYEIVCQCLTC